MDFENFFPNLKEDDPIRKLWWERFQKAETLARSCVGSWEFGKLTTAVKSDKTCWCTDGTLHITGDSLSKGAIYHELFHVVLHNSPFRKKAESNDIDYRLYCDCLCNTFEYYMEVEFGPPEGDWLLRMGKWKSKTWAEIIAESGCLSYDMTYGLPAFEFIKTCTNLAAFKKLFADLNAKS